MTQKVNIDMRKGSQGLLKKSRGRREGDHILLFHALVSYPARVVIRAGKERNKRKSTERDDPNENEDLWWEITQKMQKIVQ